MRNYNLDKFLYGGDYNPNQWPEEIWEEDMRIFKLADINVASINVFSWARLQPSEESYDFSQLDDIVSMLVKNEYTISMGTSTAALPAWMCKRYPEVTRTNFFNLKNKFGHRHNHCPNSEIFKKYARELVEQIVHRYKDVPNIKIWHISNEYSAGCYCENCEKAFRVWLKKRYKSIESLNKAWNTEFWSHTFYDWDEIVIPNAQGDGIDNGKSAFSGISVDYDRFMSDSLLDNYIMERDVIQETIPNAICTTNFMGSYKPLNYFKWANEMEIISWDNYPSYNTPLSETAFNHDLMRGLKKGQPFMLMEQTPSQQNWQPYNSLKKPGQMRSLSYQAIAHGADTVQFFQLRRSVGACEKFHGAVIDHVGHENTRVFKEVAELGKELSKNGELFLNARKKSEVAIIFDWENWWALDYAVGPHQNLNYIKHIHQYYKFFYDNNISIDIVSKQSHFDGYKLIIAPNLYMINEDEAQRLENYVSKGGNFLTTYMSGIVGESDNVHLGGYPGPLKKILGIWVEEFDALGPDETNTAIMNNKEFNCGLICDIMHLETAIDLAKYSSNFYKGTPVITKNRFNKGHAYYVGSQLEENFMNEFLNGLTEELSLSKLAITPKDVEVSCREHSNGDKIYYLINHNNKECVVYDFLVGEVDILSREKNKESITLAPYDVKVFYLKENA